MAKTGYIFYSRHYEGLEQDKRWMARFGCERVIIEDGVQERLRPQWRQLLTYVSRNDTIVISKLSNALRGIRELGAFLNLVTAYKVRLVSIHDGIDTAGELFPETTVGNVIATIGSLSEEVTIMRKREAKPARKTGRQKTLKANLKIDREKTVVNMYNSGYSIDDIWKASGYKSRTSIFRVLNRAGVQLNRGPHSGPIKKKSERES